MVYRKPVSLAITIGCLCVYQRPDAAKGARRVAKAQYPPRKRQRWVGYSTSVAAGAKASELEFTMPFGLVQMDNGEIAILCSSEKQVPKGPRSFEPAVAFSKDGGATWSPFMIIPSAKGRPHFLESLGGGRLSFITEVFGTPDKPLKRRDAAGLAQRSSATTMAARGGRPSSSR